MSAIEDTLKTIRALHRLVIGVSLAGAVFALSLRPPDEITRTLEAIDELAEFDFSAYEGWAVDTVTRVLQHRVQEMTQELETVFDQRSVDWAGRKTLIEVLCTPLHIAYAKPSKIDSNWTLEEIDSFLDMYGSSLAQAAMMDRRDFNISIQRVLEEAKLRDDSDVGVRSARVYFDQNFDEISPRFESDRVAGAVSLELSDSSQHAAPILQLPFTAVVQSFDATDLNTFLKSHITSSGLPLALTPSGGRLSLFAGLPARRDDLKRMTVSEAQAALQEDLVRISPDQRDLLILGVTVPGRLVIIAAPLTCCILLLYLASHIRHLHRCGRGKSSEISAFSWLPISITQERLWCIEPILTLVCLPMITAALLIWRVGSFGTINWITLLVTIVSTLASLTFAASAVEAIAALRGRRISEISLACMNK